MKLPAAFSSGLRLAFPVMLAFTVGQLAAQTIWVEGERPTRASVRRPPSASDRVRADLLSGGEWIAHDSDDRDGQADYVIQAPATARYVFWVRADPVEARLAYSIGRGPWVPIDMARDVVDKVDVAADDKAGPRPLGWKQVGEFVLAKGRHTVRFRIGGGGRHGGAIDAFVFTTAVFKPSGTLRPGEALAVVGAGTVGGRGRVRTWPFLPPRDTFPGDAVLDLRSLNERVAGQSGFVRLGADGESFVLGDGSPARFWAINSEVARYRNDQDLVHSARFLAKRGVNMTRIGIHIYPKDGKTPFFQADRKQLDLVWRHVAAHKKEGIYTTLTPYWSAIISRVPASWEIEGWPEKAAPFGLLFFNPRLQQGFKSWLKELMTTPNPYTGIPLAKDPAVAIFQIQNEDSLLFWTIQSLKGRQLEFLGKRFGEWLTQKYGSLDRSFQAWDGDSMKEDDPARGVVGIHIVWELTQARQGGRKKRLDDQLQFFAETMFRFNQEIGRYLREDLGCRLLVNAGNWRTADMVKLNDVERWSYTANDVLAVNSYYDPIHIGPDRGWRINAGDRFQDVSALFTPRALPLNVKQVAGHPMMITETHWVPPLSYLSESPLLVSAYQSLTGIDAVFWNGTAEAEWAAQDRAEWDAASRAKWTVATPMMLGQFPAAALIYRKGYIDEGKPVVIEHRPVDQLWQRLPPIIAEDPTYDPNRDLGDAARRSNLPGGVDPLAFLVGPVRVVYDNDPSKTWVADLSGDIDHVRKIVRSATGQVAWDYGTGLLTVDAPKAQGAAGFLARKSPVKLTDVTIASSNEYAAVVAVSLDGLPLSRSSRVLVQVATRARPTGWAEHETTFVGDNAKETYKGKQVDSTGKMPWMIVSNDVTLSIANPALTSATALDAVGKPRHAVKSQRVDGGLRVVLPPDALYVVLQKR